MSSRMRLGAISTVLAAVMLTGCFGNSAEQYLGEAKAKIANKERESAVIQLKNALQKDANLAEARFLLGQLLLEGGDARGAAIELGKAQELGYPKDQLIPLMAQALAGQGSYQQVLSSYAGMTLGTPAAMSDLQASLAVAYGGVGQATKAMDAVKAAVAADPKNARAQLVRVRLLSNSAGVGEALKALDEFMAAVPGNSEAWQVKGELLNREGQADEALKALREAVNLNKGNVGAQLSLMNLLLARKDVDAATAQLAALRAAKANPGQVLMFSTLLALERKDLKQARESVQALLKGAPDDVRVLHLAGVVEFRRGALLEAENFLGKALQSAPNLVKARLLLAQTKLRQGDPAKTLAVLQPLLGEQGGSVEAYTMAAEAYLQTGDPRRAEEYFGRASELNPNDLRSRVALALAQVAKGRVAEGVATLRTIAASDAGTMADMGLVTVYLQRREWDQALKALDGLEAKTRERPTAANLRGRVELARGNKVAARQAFEAALKIDPVYFPAAASLAALDLDDKQVEAAKARFKPILDNQPNSVPANMALIALAAKSGASPDELAGMLEQLVKQVPTEAAPRLALVETQLRRKDLKAAMAAAQEATASLPDNADAWRLLAQVQHLSGDANQATSSITKWASLAPRSPEPQMALAELFAKQGDKVQQVQSLKRALAIRPDYLPAQLKLFAGEMAATRYTEARRLAEQVQAQRPNEAMGKALSGDVYGAQKNWPAAVGDYRAALKLEPVPEVAVKLHRALGAGGKGSEAKSFESEWMGAHPQDVVFLDHLGTMALMQENFALAEQRYLSVLKIQPDNAMAANNLAWVLNKTKKPGALAYSEKANQIAPNQPAFMDTLAEIYADGGQVDKALEVQKRAVTLAPEFAPHRLHLARYYAAAGQKSEARVELSRLAAMGAKFSQQSEVAKLLATL
ncbi:XrtA/PEP-CTERM system TPR-repeat protein PrsT [Pelomonas sp. KK5]|uniref:XrtA/PEP-CTERM system TPR-repeat protein PrsT n=1 Tax=Pelomonas sp. KK5 TaxID=1855730 RepID=UPI00097C4804|nr:XrtA/PEP-CTERM system TPR-repeat protein PrsT [Pelomonas sp. KK5]